MTDNKNVPFFENNIGLTFHNTNDINKLQPNDMLTINSLTSSAEERNNNNAVIQKYNDENKAENDTADFSKLKWGRNLSLAPIQAKDGSTTYICREIAEIPLENGNKIRIEKREHDTYSYQLLDNDNNIISSSFHLKKEDVANNLKEQANNVKKKPENTSQLFSDIKHTEIVEEKLELKEIDLSQNIDVSESMHRIDAMVRKSQQEFKSGLKKLDSQFPSAEQYLERIKRRQQEFLEEKEGIAPKTAASKKISKTNISKEDMAAYIAKNSKQNQ